MPTTGTYFNTPAELNVGDWALVPARPEGVEELDPTLTPMELVLVMDKKGEGESLVFVCIDTNFDVKERRVSNVFLNCCEGKARHPKHVCIQPQRPMQDEAFKEHEARVLAHLSASNKMMQRILPQL